MINDVILLSLKYMFLDAGGYTGTVRLRPFESNSKIISKITYLQPKI